MIDGVLLACARLGTFAGDAPLTNASSFFFARGQRLFVVTSGHVLHDEASGHRPDRIQIEMHNDAANLAESTGFSMPLYRDGRSLWRQGLDAAGEIDVAVLEVNRAALPAGAVWRAFTPASLVGAREHVEIGTSLLVIGFPLGFHDTLHHAPVARHAALASAWDLRFQGEGLFLTDGRTHRGSSGAPVVMRATQGVPKNLPWKLLGVHSSRLDIGTRDLALDEALGLNCAWYADILLTLTA